MCVMILSTSNQDKVRSNNFNVQCVSHTSEFQGDSVEKIQFDENKIWESDAYDCSIKNDIYAVTIKKLCYN